ncbi:Mediator of RNA polymerase II transcription subunit 15a [Linum perenne]
MSLQSSSCSSSSLGEKNHDGISSSSLDAQYCGISSSNWKRQLHLELQDEITEAKEMCLIAIEECRQVSHERSIDPGTMEMLECYMGYLSDTHSDKSRTALNSIKEWIHFTASSVTRGQSSLNLIPIEMVVRPVQFFRWKRPADLNGAYWWWLKSQVLAKTFNRCYMKNLVEESVSCPTRSDTALDSRKSDSGQCILLKPVTAGFVQASGYKLLQSELFPLIQSWRKQVQLASEKAPCDSVNDIWSIVNLSDCLAGAAPVPGAEGSIPNPFTIPKDDISSLSLYLELNDSPCTTPTDDIWSPSPYLELNDSPFTIPTDDIWSPSPYLELNDNPWATPTDYISSLSPYFELSDSPSTKKMKRSFDAVATNFIPLSDADMSTARIKTNQALEEEIRGINQRLLDTMVTIIRDGNSGTMVNCSFNTVTISPKRPIEPLHLLIPENYPQSSPTVLLETRPGDDEFSVKGKSRLEVCLGSLHQPLSLEDIAKSWGACVRGVITEYAMQNGGGSFSSRYGTWETVSNDEYVLF